METDEEIVVTNAVEKKFVKKAEAAGYEVYMYSGRCMYGRQCPAINCDNVNDALAEIGMKGLRTDSMGLGSVIYTG